MIIYDVVFIGASPLAVIEAASCSKQGLSVSILERKPSVGGAWGVVNLFGARDVESGCHILDISKNSGPIFKFLLNILGINLSIWKKQPLRLYNNKKFRYNSCYYIFKDVPLLAKGAKTSLLRSRSFRERVSITRNFLFQITDILKRYLRDFYYWRAEFYYFKNGTAGLLKELSQIISNYSIDLNLNTNVENVVVKPSGLVEVSVGDKIVHCKTLYLTSGSEVESIVAEGKIVNIPVSKRLFNHLFLHIKDKKGEEITYVHDLTHKYLFRLNDVTSTVNEEWRLEHPSHRIFVALLREDICLDTNIYDEVVESILCRMKDVDLIDSEAILLDKEFISTEVFHRSFEGLSFNIPQIKFFRSTNLVKSLHSNFLRWQKIWNYDGL